MQKEQHFSPESSRHVSHFPQFHRLQPADVFFDCKITRLTLSSKAYRFLSTEPLKHTHILNFCADHCLLARVKKAEQLSVVSSFSWVFESVLFVGVWAF